MSAARKPNLAALKAVDLSDQMAEHFNDPANEGKLFIPRSSVSLAMNNTIGFRYSSIEQAFPNVDPGLRPFGNLVLVQIRVALERSGSIILDTEQRRTEQYNTQVAKVIAIGPIAFKNRNTGDDWPEGAWARPGMFVRVPKYQGDRWMKSYSRPESRYDQDTNKWVETDKMAQDDVEFVLFKDLALLGEFTEDPLLVKAFI